MKHLVLAIVYAIVTAVCIVLGWEAKSWYTKNRPRIIKSLKAGRRVVKSEWLSNVPVAVVK